MKTFFLSLAAILFCNPLLAQSDAGMSTKTTVYKDFQPAIIVLSNGKSITEKQANIFLKNGSLLYKHNKSIMQANMENVSSVRFSDRSYLRIDTLLAYVVDTLKTNKLLCATLIDMESYANQIVNDRQITNLELGGHVNISSIDNYLSDDIKYPLVNYFFFEIDGKVIKAHERTLKKALPKAKQRMFNAIIQSPEFHWGEVESLTRILKLFDVEVS